MRYLLFILLFFQIAILFGQTPANDPHWQLLWQDEFDSCCLNTNRWIRANDCDHGGEPELYLTQNVYTSGGNLVIEIDKNPTKCPVSPDVTSWACGSCVPGLHQYTSGWVETAETNVQYGYFEARIKLPYGFGFWPAFWTWIGVPNHQEMDFFEMNPGLPFGCGSTSINNNYTATSNMYYVGNEVVCNPNRTIYSIQDYTQWHTYGVEWSPSRVIYYLDNEPVRLIQNSKVINSTRIIFNLAVNKGSSEQPNSSTPFPSYMLIDFVKVYTLSEDCNDYIDAMNYDFSTYNNMEKNFIEIGDGGGNNSLSVGDNVLIRASQYIKISGNFYVPVGASFYADANGDCPNNINTACSLTFNPCTYDFTNYDNTVKKIIELGGTGCNINITPVHSNLLLEATGKIILKPGARVIPISGKPVELKIVSCQ